MKPGRLNYEAKRPLEGMSTRTVAEWRKNRGLPVQSNLKDQRASKPGFRWEQTNAIKVNEILMGRV
jgi:hypothetical protein